VTTDHPIHQRSRALLVVSSVIVYYAAADFLVSHLALPLDGTGWYGLAYQGLRLALLLAGLQILAYFWPSEVAGDSLLPEASPLGWRWGRKSRGELAAGLALGWGIAVLLVLPVALDGGLQIYFDASMAAWGRLALIVLATACGAALRQTVLCGLPFRRLVDASRPVTAVLLVCCFAVLTQFRDVRGSWAALLAVVLFQALCCLAALRTGSLWLGVGMDLAARIFLGSVFGFTVLGSTQYSSNVLSGSYAPDWLTGSVYGPAGGWLAPIVLLVAMAVLFRVTQIDVIAQIKPGGIPMNVAEVHAPAFPAIAPPPPAGASLVQIAAPAPAPEIPLPPKIES
jgi:hypothetical protein